MSIKCPKCQTENPDAQKFCGECATPLQTSNDIGVTRTIETPSFEFKRGTMFADRYEIIEELGKGGMGSVYRVEDTKTKEEIALKLIKPEIASDKKTIERFRNELTTARKIRHKNVCGMYDLGEHEGAHFITMEYVSGEDLKSFIMRSKRLSIPNTLSIARQVCEGLEEAHRLGVVHRDLKPSNIMIDKEGNARVMDFGIARSLKARGITGAGLMVGTPEYMSPEQAEAKDVDHRSDIYSLGLILYEMATGQLPFEGDSPLSIAMKQKGEIPKDPKELNPQIPDGLSFAIMMCLEKDKERRYQSASELRSELEAIEKGIPTTTRAVPERKPFTSKEITVTFGVKKLLIPALVIFAVVIIGLILWKFLPKEKILPSLPSDKPFLAIMYFKNNTGDESLNHWRTALSDSIITDLSQSRYFEVLSSDQLFSILRKLNLLDAANYATEDLRQVAAEGGVNYVLMGSLFQSGNIFRIDYRIQEIATGKNKGTSRVEVQGKENILSMVDEVTKKIKQEFNISQEKIAVDIDRDIETITTSSVEALKYYSQGRQAHNVGEYQKSIALMERAVAADPEFAMAYRSMADAYAGLRLDLKVEESMTKAFEMSHHLPDREKYIIRGDFYSRSSETYDKALENYDKVLELYPEDQIANTNSAGIYSTLEQYDKAVERLEISRRYKSVQPYIILASTYSYQGQYDKARDVALDYLENIQENAPVRRTLAYIYTGQRKFDQALTEIEKAIALAPDDFYISNVRRAILVFKGELEEARSESLRLLDSENPVHKEGGLRGLLLVASLQGKFGEATNLAEQVINVARSGGQRSFEVQFREMLIDIYFYLGKWDEAFDQINKASSIAVERESQFQQRRLLVARGIYFLKSSSIQDALKTAEELRELVESGLNIRAERDLDYLMGRIEYERNNYAGAVEYLQRARSQLRAEWSSMDRQAKFYFALGQAHYRAGNLVEAQKTFEEITLMTFGRNYCQHLYVLAFYELGRIFEELGDTAKAIENYEKFLDLWKDADPGIAEVDNARQRLSRLKSTQD